MNDLHLLTLLADSRHERLLDDALRDFDSISRIACRKARDVDRHLDRTIAALVVSDTAVDSRARRRLRELLQQADDRPEIPVIVLGDSTGLYQEWRDQLEPRPVVALSAPCTADHLTRAVEASMIYRDHGWRLHGAGHSLQDLQDKLYKQFVGLAETLFASTGALATGNGNGNGNGNGSGSANESDHSGNESDHENGWSSQVSEQLDALRRSLDLDDADPSSPFQALEALASQSIGDRSTPDGRLHDSAKHRPARGRAPAQVAQEIALRYRRLSVLVAEDHDDAREALLQLLHLWGCHYVGVANGNDAVSQAKNEAEQFDLILLDLDLPGLGGLEVARTLRDELGADCPMLVAITSFGSDVDRARTHDAGFDLHLVKPVDLDRLRQLLGALGQGSESGNEPN